MESPDLVFTVIYVLMAMCFISPPTEFVSAGLTVQNILAPLLGSEDMFFIQYHIKRTTATLLIHSLLPLVYYIFMGYLVSENHLFEPLLMSPCWIMFLGFCVGVPAATAVLAFYWHSSKWSNHPIAKSLSHYADSNSTWQSVASRINIEYRRMDKFTTGPHGRRVAVTDSWVLKTTAYALHVAYQSDVHLTLVSTDEHALAEDSTTGVQFLNIDITSIHTHTKPFRIRLNSVEYSDLKEKIKGPIRVVQNVVVHQTLSDRFLQVFDQQVSLNDRYHRPPDMCLEQCIGCMQKPAEIKLRRLCAGDEQGGPCVSCLCRPMWCLECMGKWFASRQNQQEPQTWLASRCPCPTCRSIFCMLDVCKIV